MNLRYFKTQKGDFYAPEGNFENTLEVTSKEIHFCGADELDFSGRVYKELQITKEAYEKLFNSAVKGDRKQTTGLLKKLHERNSGILQDAFYLSITSEEPPFAFESNLQKAQKFFEQKPILE